MVFESMNRGNNMMGIEFRMDEQRSPGLVHSTGFPVEAGINILLYRGLRMICSAGLQSSSIFCCIMNYE